MDPQQKSGVKYKILKCVISASNIIPSERRHNTRASTRLGKRTSTKPLRSSRRSINYAKLNDGLDPYTPPSPKRPKRNSYRPQKDGPSEQRLTAHVGHEKNASGLDLEQIMDTTLEEEDNTDISQPIASESDTLIQPTLGGVTDMDGVSNDAPTPNLETGTGTEQNTPQAENNLDGVTDDDHSPRPHIL